PKRSLGPARAGAAEGSVFLGNALRCPCGARPSAGGCNWLDRLDGLTGLTGLTGLDRSDRLMGSTGPIRSITGPWRRGAIPGIDLKQAWLDRVTTCDTCADGPRRFFCPPFSMRAFLRALAIAVGSVLARVC